MTRAPESLPADLAAAHAMILAERAARLAAEAERSSGAALIAHLKLQIEKLRRELYGTRSECTARLLAQMVRSEACERAARFRRWTHVRNASAPDAAPAPRPHGWRALD